MVENGKGKGQPSSVQGQHNHHPQACSTQLKSFGERANGCQDGEKRKGLSRTFCNGISLMIPGRHGNPFGSDDIWKQGAKGAYPFQVICSPTSDDKNVTPINNNEEVNPCNPLGRISLR